MRFPMIGITLVVLAYTPARGLSQDKAAPRPSAAQASGEQSRSGSSVSDVVDPLHQQFAARFSNVKLVGWFTVIGKDDRPLAKEEYTIRKVDKVPEGDKWIFHCRIKYGGHDVTLPLPLDVKWADDTPVITLDNLAIPPLGTFSSRVVLHDDKYAGTWRHDNVSGHLFGTIEKVAEEPAPISPAPGN